MKKNLPACITSIAFMVLVVLPVRVAAQHPRYKLVDLGTLGGPIGYGSVNGDGFRLLNQAGVVSSYADTALPDPFAPDFCFDADCRLAHAYRWKNGVITDLGALDNRFNSAAGSINARGWSTGQSQTGEVDPFGFPIPRAALWKGRTVVDLGTLEGGLGSLGIYVNDAGQVVGLGDNGEPDPFSLFGIGVEIRTFLWENGVMQDIGTLGGPDAAPGAGCDNQRPGYIVGASFTSFTPNDSTGIPSLHPFLWNDGTVSDLGNLGGTLSGAQCANTRGDVIGSSTLEGDLVSHAFLWRHGVMTDLGTLGGPNSEAIWLNDAGLIVGSADLPGDNVHDAVVWKDGKVLDLGTVDGDVCSRGRGLNARGQVVGGSSDCRNFLHAFVWEENGPMLDLNGLIAPGSGWQLTNAFNINDRGEILAKAAPVGFTPNDDEDLGHLVLLVPCDDASESSCGADSQATTTAPAQGTTQSVRGGTGTDFTPRARTPKENVAAWRARFAKQYRLSAPRKN